MWRFSPPSPPPAIDADTSLSAPGAAPSGSVEPSPILSPPIKTGGGGSNWAHNPTTKNFGDSLCSDSDTAATESVAEGGHGAAPASAVPSEYVPADKPARADAPAALSARAADAAAAARGGASDESGDRLGALVSGPTGKGTFGTPALERSAALERAKTAPAMILPASPISNPSPTVPTHPYNPHGSSSGASALERSGSRDSGLSPSEWALAAHGIEDEVDEDGEEGLPLAPQLGELTSIPELQALLLRRDLAESERADAAGADALNDSPYKCAMLEEIESGCV